MKIHKKITLVFCVIVALVSVGVFSYLDITLKDFFYTRIKTALSKEVLLAKMFLEKDFPGYPRFKEIDDIADTAGLNLKARVTIIGVDGRVLGDSDLDGDELKNIENHLYRPEVQDALRKGIGESKRFSTTVKKDMLYIAAAFGKEKTEGVVRLALPLSDMAVLSGYLKKTLLITLIIAFFVAVAASIGASSYISKPINYIAMAAKEISAGDFSRKIRVTSNDEIGALANTFNNMSEEIRFQIEEATEKRTQLEAVLFSMFDGLMVVDSKCKIILMNAALKKLFSIEQEPFGKSPIELIRNVGIQEIAESVLQAYDGVKKKELSVMFAEEKSLIIHGTPIMRDGKILGGVLVFHDVTDLKRLEMIRKDFIANVSHELRTPVSNIKGYSETLLEGALDEKKNAKEFVEIISKSAERLVQLIDDLLDLSKIESGKISIDRGTCSMKNITQKALDEMLKTGKRKNINITNNIPDTVPDVSADEYMILQVLLNLLDNSIKYSNGDNNIDIQAHETEGFVRVDIKDQGIGIPENDLPRIFERFYRVDKARSRELGGTGLGLSIVKHIIQEHGGEVSVESVLGKGSTFSFTLPKA